LIENMLYLNPNLLNIRHNDNDAKGLLKGPFFISDICIDKEKT